jgi:hypothetical protein
VAGHEWTRTYFSDRGTGWEVNKRRKGRESTYVKMKVYDFAIRSQAKKKKTKSEKNLDRKGGVGVLS